MSKEKTKCNKCKDMFIRKDWQIKQREFSCPSCRAIRQKTKREQNVDAHRKYRLDYKNNNPEKVTCRRKTRTAVSNGTLIKENCKV